MKKILFSLIIVLLTLPSFAQDEPVNATPVCSADQMVQIPSLLLDSGFLLDYALMSSPAIPADSNGTIDYLPSILEMLAVRDIWVEAIQPNLPNCVQSIELQFVFGDYLDQGLIQMMTSMIIDPTNADFADREDIEMARLQGFDDKLFSSFETIFADIDIETILLEQMEAREAGD